MGLEAVPNLVGGESGGAEDEAGGGAEVMSHQKDPQKPANVQQINQVRINIIITPDRHNMLSLLRLHCSDMDGICLNHTHSLNNLQIYHRL